MTNPARRMTLVVRPGLSSQRIDAVVVELLRDTGINSSRTTIRQWIDDNRVTIDGVPVKASNRITVGATIEVDPAPPPPSEAEPDPTVAFKIMYQDEHLLVVDKPAGLVVHPARGHRDGTLVNGLLALGCFDRSITHPSDPGPFPNQDAVLRPGIVHRIDKNTSGILVVARTATARENLKAMFARHDIEREYRAVVVGHATSATYNTPHGRHATQRLRFTTINPVVARQAITHVSVMEILADGQATLVSCRLETGRTHQIRTHLFECGRTPVLGDAIYGSRPTHELVREVEASLNRHWLHAHVLGFAHPITREQLRFVSDLPSELQGSLGALRLGRAATDVACMPGCDKR